jgi:PKD repeat protein
MKKSVLIVAVAAGFAGACVHKSEEPPLSGPSTFARSLTIAVTPDHITQDGASQASVAVQAVGPNGASMSGVTVRFDTLVDGSLLDVGKLSARTAVTGTDGVARVTFTAPPPSPPPFDSSVNVISVRALQLGSDSSTTVPVTADISLMPPGVIQGPPDTPTASFFIFPTAPTVGASVHFDASASCPGPGANGACSPTNSGPIVSYQWSFGDGGTGSGVTVDHAFPIPQAFPVTLIVTNSRGVSAGTSMTVIVTDGKPTASFTASVQNAATHTMTFDGSSSAAVVGSTIVSYQWAFGDGAFATTTAPTTTHTYTASGSFTVRLVVTDNLGRTSTNPGSTVSVP